MMDAVAAERRQTWKIFHFGGNGKDRLSLSYLVVSSIVSRALLQLSRRMSSFLRSGQETKHEPMTTTKRGHLVRLI
jgi:hypothetical protein